MGNASERVVSEAATEARREELRRRRPSSWRSKSLKLMLVVTAIGLGMWVYSMATAPETPAVVGVSSSAAISSLSPGALSTPSPDRRLIDESAPATFRFGFSFVVGFFVAWLFRRFIKMLLLIAGGIATLIILLKATGVVKLDLDAWQGHVDQGLDLAQREASRFKDFILGYVPSGISAAAGMVAGARRRAG